MNYGNIKEYDIANGEGVRISLLYPAADTIVRVVLMQKHGILILASPIRKKWKTES